METTSLLSRLLSAARTVTPLTPITAVASEMPDLVPGQTVQARVAERLSDGTTRVTIGDAALTLALPRAAQPGDLVTLRLVSLTPRPQFELQSAPAPAQPQVSAAGRLLGQLVNAPASAPPRQQHPIVASPSAEASQWQEPLARAVERSGLFYESHQARWVRGSYSLERLREEPQAVIGAARAARPVGDEGEAADETRAPAELGAPRAPAALRSEPQEQASTPSTSLAARAAPASNEPIDEIAARETLPLVRQQLETLETRHFGWQGEVWPGQLMDWEIEQGVRDDGREEPSERDWTTRLALTLPALGELGATLKLSGSALTIMLDAQAPESARTLRSAAPELERALRSAGLEVVDVKVAER